MAVDYEVKEAYRDHSVTQLLNSPITCFQGVGDTQKDILENYFGVKTVKDLANIPHFLEALQIQELAHQGGNVPDMSVEEAGKKQTLNFAVRDPDRTRKISDLLKAPAHVLDDMTPAQDLAYYDAFRITNLSQLAHNRIMLEARVIDYLAREGGEGDQDAAASILGEKQAAASKGEGGLAQAASEISSHVRDRVAAMRQRQVDHVQDRASLRDGSTLRDGGVTSVDRLDSIRSGREGGGARGRASELASVRAGTEDKVLTPTGGGAQGTGRVNDILSARGGTSDALDGADRAAAVLAAREGGGEPGVSTSGTPSYQAKKPVQAEPSEEELAAGEGGGEQPPEDTAASRQERQLPPRGVFIAAAVVLVLLLIGLGVFLFSGDDEAGMADADSESGQAVTEDATDGTAADGTAADGTAAEGTAADGTAADGTAADSTAADGAAGDTATTAAGTGEKAGTSGEAATTGSGTSPRIKDTHTVRRGDTLWDISKRQYQSPLSWPSIYEENRDSINHPDLIFPRQKFRIPESGDYTYPEYPKDYQRRR